MLNRLILFVLVFSTSTLFGQDYQLGLVKYKGGGDWYANLETSLPNLIAFCNTELDMNIKPEQAVVELTSDRLFGYPWLHMTGHGNVVFSDQEVNNLRTYLSNGGFLHIDDNYGMDPFVRTEMKKVFPELEWQEIPISHPLFNEPYKFPKGVPKIHEHDDKRPQVLGLIHEGKIICLYTYEADLGDGWEDPQVHNDPQSKHTEALQFGANILYFVFMKRS